MTTIKVGDIVAYCYSGNHGFRRLRNMSVVRVMKTFIETNDGSRFSPYNLRQTLFSDGRKGLSNYRIDPQVSYWDQREEREKVMNQMRLLFSQLSDAAGSQNWEKTQEAFNNLKTFMGECDE